VVLEVMGTGQLKIDPGHGFFSFPERLIDAAVGAAAEGQQSVGAGSRQGAVVALALRFALNARPAGSQGCAPGKAHEKNKNRKTKERQKNKNHKKGTLLMS